MKKNKSRYLVVIVVQGMAETAFDFGLLVNTQISVIEEDGKDIEFVHFTTTSDGRQTANIQFTDPFVKTAQEKHDDQLKSKSLQINQS